MERIALKVKIERVEKEVEFEVWAPHIAVTKSAVAIVRYPHGLKLHHVSLIARPDKNGVWQFWGSMEPSGIASHNGYLVCWADAEGLEKAERMMDQLRAEKQRKVEGPKLRRVLKPQELVDLERPYEKARDAFEDAKARVFYARDDHHNPDYHLANAQAALEATKAAFEPLKARRAELTKAWKAEKAKAEAEYQEALRAYEASK